MRLGATLVHLSDAPPFAVAEWAQRLVAAGFESLWTPHIVGRGALVPEPITTLAVAAAVTDGVELGTATLQLPLSHPADLAHRLLSLLLICGERLTVGVSPGSTEADYASLDRDFAARFTTFDERVTRLRELLAGGLDQPEGLDGRGMPPILLGSWGAKVERAAREFDGWLASAYRRTPEEIIAAHDRYRAAGGQRAVVCAIPVRRGDDLAVTRATLHRYAEAGFDDAVVLFAPDGPSPEEVRALSP